MRLCCAAIVMRELMIDISTGAAGRERDAQGSTNDMVRNRGEIESHALGPQTHCEVMIERKTAVFRNGVLAQSAYVRRLCPLPYPKIDRLLTA